MDSQPLHTQDSCAVAVILLALPSHSGDGEHYSFICHISSGKGMHPFLVIKKSRRLPRASSRPVFTPRPQQLGMVTPSCKGGRGQSSSSGRRREKEMWARHAPQMFTTVQTASFCSVNTGHLFATARP